MNKKAFYLGCAAVVVVGLLTFGFFGGLGLMLWHPALGIALSIVSGIAAMLLTPWIHKCFGRDIFSDK